MTSTELTHMESKLTIDQYGTKEWRLTNGLLHREDGPAIEYIDGDKHWYINGKRHRGDGPGVEWSNGYKVWYINDIQYTEQKHKSEMRSIKLTKLLK